MAGALVITIPAYNTGLRDEIESGLAQCAKVSHDEARDESQAFDLDSIRLIIEVVVTTTTIAANVAAITDFLLKLREKHRREEGPSDVRVGGRGEPTLPLESIDEASLHRMLGSGSEEGKAL